MSLLSLPTELHDHILEHLDVHDLNAVVRTNCYFHQLFNSSLYDFDRQYCNSSALLWAATHGELRTTQLALCTKKGTQAIDDHCQAALLLAIENGHRDVVEMLANNNVNVNAQGGCFEYFGNALQTASWLGDYQIMKLLIERGADVNMRGGHYGNALQVASWRASWTGEDHIVRLLLDHNADTNSLCGHFGSALQAASWGGCFLTEAPTYIRRVVTTATHFKQLHGGVIDISSRCC
jgi:ankyrin repeat protein